jgi:DNA-binding transcriptional LysR family regulator
MVAAGSGITMVPKSLGRLIPKGVVFRKLPTPEPLIEHTFAYPSQNTSPALSEFLKLLDGDSNG